MAAGSSAAERAADSGSSDLSPSRTSIAQAIQHNADDKPALLPVGIRRCRRREWLAPRVISLPEASRRSRPCVMAGLWRWSHGELHTHKSPGLFPPNRYRTSRILARWMTALRVPAMVLKHNRCSPPSSRFRACLAPAVLLMSPQGSRCSSRTCGRWAGDYGQLVLLCATTRLRRAHSRPG